MTPNRTWLLRELNLPLKTRGFHQPGRVAKIPALVLGQYHLRVIGGMKIQSVDAVTVRLGVIRAEGERPLIAGNCLVKVSLIFEDIPEIVVGFGKIGPKRQRPPERGDGLVQPAGLLERVAEIVVR